MVRTLAIGLIVIATFIGAIGALLLKKATTDRTFKQALFHWLLWAGFSLYGISTIFYILAMRIEQLSAIYPLVSLSYLWTCFFSVKYLGEKMNPWKYVGLLGIIIGIILIGIGS
jgi:uncharacterized membrane protein